MNAQADCSTRVCYLLPFGHCVASAMNLSDPNTPPPRLSRHPSLLAAVSKRGAADSGRTWQVGCPPGVVCASALSQNVEATAAPAGLRTGLALCECSGEVPPVGVPHGAA